MKTFQALIAGTVSMALFAGTALSSERQAFPQFVRPLGMGGAFTAVADDHNIFSFNPAGMVQRTGGEFTLLELAVGGSEDLKKASDFIDENQDDLEDFDNLSAGRKAELANQIQTEIEPLRPRVYAAADVASYVSGPSFLGIPLHVGFGALAVADGSFQLGFNLSPSISYEVNNDFIIPLSLARRFEMPFLPGKIGVGVTGKYVNRTQIKQDRQNITVLDDLESPPEAKGTGMGGDVGFLYQPTDRINFGVMVQDIGGTKLSFDAVEAENGYAAQDARTGVIRSATNIGLALTPERLLWILPTGNRLTLAADVRDLFNKDKHILFENGFKKPFGEDAPKQIHMGAEFKYWFLRFRGGAYQGYPSFGLGVDLPILKLNYAYYSQELGARAGDRRQENHVVSLSFKFGTNYTESRERIKNGNTTKEDKKMAVPESAPVATPAATPAPEPVTPTPEASPAAAPKEN